MASTDDTVQTQLRIPRALWERIKAAGKPIKRSGNFMAIEALEVAFPEPGAKRQNRQAGRIR